MRIGTAYPPRSPGCSHVYVVVRVVNLFLCFALLVFVLCFVLNVVYVYGLSILDCPFGFLCLYITEIKVNK